MSDYANPYAFSKSAKIISVTEWGDKLAVLVRDEYEHYNEAMDEWEQIKREPSCLMTQDELAELRKWLKGE